MKRLELIQAYAGFVIAYGDGIVTVYYSQDELRQLYTFLDFWFQYNEDADKPDDYTAPDDDKVK